MNRRHFVLATLAAGSMPVLVAAQTPLASPAHDESAAEDSRALDLLGLLQTISPVELVRALQTTAVDNEALADGRVVPWVDFGDTDLYSSLGGAVILAGDVEINDPEAALLGGTSFTNRPKSPTRSSFANWARRTTFPQQQSLSPEPLCGNWGTTPCAPPSRVLAT